MIELKEHGELTGLNLVQHLMSNWRSQLDIEHGRWRKQDEQAYQQIKKIINEYERIMILKKTAYLESTSDPPDLEKE